MVGAVSAGRACLALLASGTALLAFAAPSRADRAWVKDELLLNLRAGPGLEFRILGVIKTGDRVEVLERRPKWTQVETEGLGSGWIPVGYLQAEPPDRLRLAQREAETAELRERVARLSEEASQLRSKNEKLARRDEGRAAKMERLVRENLELRVGARWPEWVAGACILSVGMILGSLLQRSSSRRKTSRIRL